MKRIFIITMSLMTLALPSMSQSAPKWTKKVKKSIFSVMAYDKDSTLLQSGTGFFVSEDGNAVCDSKVFKKAHTATAIDYKGNKYPIDLILGADNAYGLIRFHVDTKESEPVKTVDQTAVKEEKVWTLAYSADKPSFTSASIDSVSHIGDSVSTNCYYTLSKAPETKFYGCPVFNADGEAVAIMQPSSGEKGFALDINYIKNISIQAIGSKADNIILNDTDIPKGLPESMEESLVYLYMKSRTASNSEYIGMLDLFISKYPNNAEGYFRHATPMIDTYQFDKAEADLNKYYELSEEKDKALYNISQTILSKLIYQPESAYDKWTFDYALEKINQAISLNPSLENKLMKAQILMSKKDYASAYDCYDEINKSKDRSPATLYAASVASAGRGDSIDQQIALLDSAIAIFGDPLPAEASEYVLKRGELYNKAGKYKKAVLDYNKFCYLCNNKVNDRFYYDREQIEVKAKMYQQAIDDINLAISHAPNVALYHAEKSGLLLRVNMIDESIKAAEKCIEVDSSYVDAYRILGYAQLQKGDKKSAMENLKKAVEMGDTTAQQIIDKYMK